MWLKVQNSGTDLPEKAFTLMGATTKDGVSSIGMFGSGNKYSIATLLRLNIPFKVFVSDQEIVFDTKKINFKEKEFDLILVNGKETASQPFQGCSEFSEDNERREDTLIHNGKVLFGRC